MNASSPQNEGESLTGILEGLTAGLETEQITIGHIVEQFKYRGFGPLLLVPALIVILPTGATGGLNLVVAGPLLSTLAGFGGGAALGGILGALAGVVSMPDYEIEFTRKHLENGNILIAVKVPEKDKADQVRDFFRAHGAVDTNKELKQKNLAYGGTNAL